MSTAKCKPAELLRQKLIKLSLEIEDRTTSIDLINKEIQKEDEAYTLLESEQTDRSNVELESIAAQHKSEREEVLQQIHNSIAIKKELAGKVQSFVDEKRQQEAEAAEAINSIRRANQSAISSALESFRGAETSRTDTFLAQEANKIKQQTIKALEPEVRRIMELHRDAIGAMKRAEEEEEQEIITSTLNAIFQQMIESFRRESKQEHDRHIAEIQDAYNERSSALYDEHTIAVSQLRHQISLSKESQRNQHNERLRQLSDRNSSEVLAARSEAEGRLSQLRRQHEQEVNAFKAKSKEELQAISNDLDQRKAEIEKDLHIRMEQERSTRVQDAKSQLMHQRDAKIEEMIRTSETDLVRHERRVRSETAKREKMARSEHVREMERIRGETRQHQEHLGSISNDIKQLQSRKVTLQKDLKSIEDATETSRQLCKEIQSNATEMKTEWSEQQAAIKAEMESELKRYGDRNQRLNEQIAEVTAQSKMNQTEHEERMRSIADEHEKTLDELDAKARADLTALDERHAEIARELEDMSTRVEHQETMLLRYTEDQKEDRKEGKDAFDGNDTKEKVERTKKRGPARIRRVLKISARTTKRDCTHSF